MIYIPFMIAAIFGFLCMMGLIGGVFFAICPPKKKKKEVGEGKPNYPYIRILEGEIYGQTFTGPGGRVNDISPVEEYRATHEPVPLVNPQPIPETGYSDYEYNGGQLHQCDDVNTCSHCANLKALHKATEQYDHAQDYFYGQYYRYGYRDV